MAVGPDEKVSYVSLPYPGLYHDMKMFKKHVNIKLSRLIKNNIDACERDDMMVNYNNDKNMYTALIDKGHKGSSKYGRFVTPKKKTARCDLYSDNKRKNGKIKNNRVIVENLFGCMKTI